MTFLFIILLSTLTSQQLYINEVVSDNDNIVFDFEGDNPDWVELYNPNDFNVNLQNYTLSDKPTNLFKWTFPEITIKAKSYLVVFCSEKDTLVNGELHTNFKISSDGEELFLYDNAEKLKDKKRLDFIELPPLTENQAYGKLPDGNGKLSYLSKNSPGETNHYSDEIICNIESGFYETDTIEVELKSTMGYEIRYTLDGTDPNENSPLYTGPIKLRNSSDKPNKYCEIISTPPKDNMNDFYHFTPTKNIDKMHNLKFVSYSNNQIVSDIYFRNYFIGDYSYYKNIPVISLELDSIDLFGYKEGIYIPGADFDLDNPGWSGNYYSIGKTEEKIANFTYFSDLKNINYSQKVTVNILGGGSRVYPQKSFKINARNINGPDELNFNLKNAKINEYKHIKLKSSYGVWSQLNIWQNELASELSQNLDFEKLNYKPAILFLNGEYWGIYTITEHKNKDYLSQFHDFNADSIDIVGHHYSTPDFGNGGNYSEVVEFMENNSLDIEENYNYVESKIDISSFIDYYSFQIIIRNMDWPFANILAWKPKDESTKWRWILYDVDGGFVLDNDYNMFEHLLQDKHYDWPNSKATTLTFRMLIKNNDFKNQLNDRIIDILSENFTFDNAWSNFTNLRDYYLNYIEKHIDRYGYPFNYSQWWRDYSNNYFTEFFKNRPAVVLEQLEDFMNISSNDLDLCPENQCDNNRITIFPNPTNGEFSIKTDSKFKICDLTIYNSTGNEIKVLTNEIISENRIFNLNDLPNGIYFIKFENNLGQFTFEKLIINK